MGNVNNPMDEAKQARLNDIITDFVSVFSKAFPVAYKDALIESIKENAQPEEDDERQLPDAPIPDTEIKCGLVTKVFFVLYYS